MKDSVLGLLRHLLTFGGGILISKGILDEGTALELVGGIVTVVGGAWSIYDKLYRDKTTEV